MHPISLISTIIQLFGLGQPSNIHYQETLICYGKVSPDLIKGYKKVVLEVDHYSKEEITSIKNMNGLVLAYFSLAEVHSEAFYFNEIRDYTLAENKLWGSHLIDFKSSDVLPILLSAMKQRYEKGIEGWFLDNLDVVSDFGENRSQRKYVIELFMKINESFPDAYIIQNGGLSLMALTHSYIDELALESVASDFSFTDEIYKLRNKTAFQQQWDRITSCLTKFNTPVILIEYADTKILTNKIRKRLEKLNGGLVVAQIDLSNLPKKFTH